jgi:polar amino acid transport system substrate-binding protein
MQISLTGLCRALLAGGLALAALAAPPAAAEGVETIKAGELSVLMNSASPPTSFVDKGAPTGMAVEIAAELARRIGLTPSYKAYADLAGVLPAISNSQHDIAAVGMMQTPQRMEVVDFSGPWYYGWFPLMVDGGSGINGYGDLAGKIVGVVSGSIQERWMKENHPEIRLSAFPNDVGSIAALNAGSVDGALTGSALVKENLKRFPNLKVAARTPTPYPNAFPLRKGNATLKAAVDKALAEMMADGTYVAIFDKWHPGDPLPEPLYDDYPALKDQRAPGVPAPQK